MLKITTGYNTINSNQSFGSARKFDRQLREIMQQDRKHAEELSQDITQSLTKSPKERPEEKQVTTQIPLYALKKENYYS